MTDTVRRRVDEVLLETTPLQLALLVGAVVVLGGMLALVQDPAVHAAAHDFRHGAGIACH